MAADSKTGYVCNYDIYLGKPLTSSRGEVGLATKVVLHLSSSSYENLDRPRTFLSHRLVDLTSLSNSPPHHGALGTLNLHSMPIPWKNFRTHGLDNTLFIILAAALNVFPLSEIISAGKPLLELNHLKLQMKVCADISLTISKWMALITQHVYKAIHAFDWTLPRFLIYNGPAKSTPVLVNGGASCTLKTGSGGGGGTRQAFPSYLLHV